MLTRFQSHVSSQTHTELQNQNKSSQPPKKDFRNWDSIFSINEDLSIHGLIYVLCFLIYSSIFFILVIEHMFLFVEYFHR
jgi:hypothetical protein